MIKKIAITGGIGSGKSLVAEYIKEKGYTVFSCDEIYNEIIRNEAYVQRVGGLFPDVLKKGSIDRKALAEIVFSDRKKLALLNALSHPLIMQKLNEKMQNCGISFAEVPLLYEGGYENEFDEIIIIKRNLQNRIIAICTRDHITPEQAMTKIAAQIDYDSEEMQKRFLQPKVHVLSNDENIFALKKATDKILERIL